MRNGMKVLGISGSLRSESWNRKLLHRALDVVRGRGAMVEELDLEQLPMYNPDLEADLGYPPAVVAMRDAISDADAIVISSPEYNSSVPAVLKNAVDWASRPPNVLFDKPVFIMGASPGRSGAGKMHMHLSYILESIGAWVVPQPRILLPEIAKVLTPEGQFKDLLVEELMENAMGRLLDVTGMLKMAVGEPRGEPVAA